MIQTTTHNPFTKALPLGLLLLLLGSLCNLSPLQAQRIKIKKVDGTSTSSGLLPPPLDLTYYYECPNIDDNSIPIELTGLHCEFESLALLHPIYGTSVDIEKIGNAQDSAQFNIWVDSPYENSILLKFQVCNGSPCMQSNAKAAPTDDGDPHKKPCWTFSIRYEKCPSKFPRTPYWLGTIELYPNPTTGPLDLYYALEEDRPMKITLRNFMGEHLAELANGTQEAGEHKLSSDILAEQPEGLYFLVFESEEHAEVKTILKN